MVYFPRFCRPDQVLDQDFFLFAEEDVDTFSVNFQTGAFTEDKGIVFSWAVIGREYTE